MQSQLYYYMYKVVMDSMLDVVVLYASSYSVVLLDVHRCKGLDDMVLG
jgi:hypothetical protein